MKLQLLDMDLQAVMSGKLDEVAAIRYGFASIRSCKLDEVAARYGFANLVLQA